MEGPRGSICVTKLWSRYPFFILLHLRLQLCYLHYRSDSTYILLTVNIIMAESSIPSHYYPPTCPTAKDVNTNSKTTNGSSDQHSFLNLDSAENNMVSQAPSKPFSLTMTSLYHSFRSIITFFQPFTLQQEVTPTCPRLEQEEVIFRALGLSVARPHKYLQPHITNPLTSPIRHLVEGGKFGRGMHSRIQNIIHQLDHFRGQEWQMFYLLNGRSPAYVVGKKQHWFVKGFFFNDIITHSQPVKVPVGAHFIMIDLERYQESHETALLLAVGTIHAPTHSEEQFIICPCEINYLTTDIDNFRYKAISAITIALPTELFLNDITYQIPPHSEYVTEVARFRTSPSNPCLRGLPPLHIPSYMSMGGPDGVGFGKQKGTEETEEGNEGSGGILC